MTPSTMTPILLALALFQTPAPPQAPAAPPPPTRAEQLRGDYGKFRSNNDLLTYKLDIRVDPDKKLVSGKNTITFRMLNDDSRVQIDLWSNLNVDKIMMGATPLKYDRELNAVFVDFPAPVKAGREIALDFYYSGTPTQTGRFGGFTFGKDPAGRPWIFTACEGEGSSIWFPSKDQWRDEVESMDISVAIPSALTDVSNGRFAGKKDLGDGYTQWNYHVNYPINSYDISVNIGAYEHFSDTLKEATSGQPLSLDFYALPEDLDKAKAQFAQAKPMIQAFEHYFGEYPFVRDGYKLIEVPYTGMEHQSAVTYGNGFKNGYGNRDYTGVGISPKFDFIIIHESAHEWFGNAVSAADVADMWIQEGWANYLETMYVEQVFGHDDAMKYANSYKTKVQNRTPIITTRGRHQEPPQDMYFKGGLMLNTMRSVMNDDAKWWALVKETYQTFKYKNILTEEMAALFTKRFGRNMTPIFNQYLRHTAIPVLELVVDERRGKVAYRWKADETAFAMPIRVGSRSAWETITPTTTWQQMDSKLTYDTFAVATDLYYVNVSKADGPFPAELTPPATPPVAAPAARAVPPEQAAYNDALKIKDLNERLAAFRQIQKDYATSPFLAQVSSTVFNLLAGMADKKAEAAIEFDKMYSDTKARATLTPEIRVLLMSSPVSRAIDNNVPLPNAAGEIAELVAALDGNAARSTVATGKELIARLHAASGETATAEKEFREALAVDSTLKNSLLALAKIEAARGDDKSALNHYLQVAAAGGLKGGDDTAFRALYKKVRGSESHLDADLDRAFKTTYPNPVTPEAWKGSPLRTTRIPLLELFTGSACPPCVAADYALDAVMERYAPKDIAVLAYHVHIPGPDPMTTAGSTARKDYYKDYVLGVPTFIVDGALSRLGGGGRENTGAAYGVYVPSIDAALVSPAEAALAVKATTNKGKVTVTTTIGNVSPGFKNLKLHVVVAEQELTFSGENGMRFHPLVVRAMAGAKPDAPGLDVTLDASGRASIETSFDVAAIADDVTKSLEAEIKRRRSTETAGATPASYKAEGHPMTSVDARKLVIVAFLQDENKHVLQSAQVHIK